MNTPEDCRRLEHHGQVWTTAGPAQTEASVTSKPSRTDFSVSQRNPHSSHTHMQDEDDDDDDRSSPNEAVQLTEHV